MYQRYFKRLGTVVVLLFVAYLFVISLPFALSVKIARDRDAALAQLEREFPVTVDPARKVIEEDVQVNEYLQSPDSPLQAGVGAIGELIGTLFNEVAASISNSFLYQPVAAVQGRLVHIHPGYRKEQVAHAFGVALGWTPGDERQFLEARGSVSAAVGSLTEGFFSPGVYLVDPGATPLAVRAIVDEQFEREILSRYTPRVAESVPLEDALIIASLIQREAAGAHDMREVSGVIWNRLFIDMRLQIDASVQYAKANASVSSGGRWWPAPRPADMSIDSPYNTYKNKGLPPGPISNPSVAAVVAALNPVSTDCIFYFHDSVGQFHCSPTYAGHVAKLKEHYGRGK